MKSIANESTVDDEVVDVGTQRQLLCDDDENKATR